MAISKMYTTTRNKVLFSGTFMIVLSLQLSQSLSVVPVTKSNGVFHKNRLAVLVEYFDPNLAKFVLVSLHTHILVLKFISHLINIEGYLVLSFVYDREILLLLPLLKKVYGFILSKFLPTSANA